jgi:hypothetical protein
MLAVVVVLAKCIHPHVVVWEEVVMLVTTPLVFQAQTLLGVEEVVLTPYFSAAAQEEVEF